MAADYEVIEGMRSWLVMAVGIRRVPARTGVVALRRRRTSRRAQINGDAVTRAAGLLLLQSTKAVAVMKRQLAVQNCRFVQQHLRYSRA
jgi:hypothetical protein